MWKERIHNEYQQPPSTSQEPETGYMSLKNDAGEGFGEDVCSVDDPRGVSDEKGFGFNVGTDEVIVYVNMLRLSMVGIIHGKGFGTIVVCRNDEGRWTRYLELLQRLTQPDALLNSASERNILSLSGGECYAVLLLC